MKRVLFVCIHNSARSQMAEALLKRACGNGVHVESAGLTPGTLNPLAVDVLKEIGVDISGKPTRDVFALYKSGALFSDVITVCDESSAERCPLFPGTARRTHWSFKDPSQFTGTYEERLVKTRAVRDDIARAVDLWCEGNCLVAA